MKIIIDCFLSDAKIETFVDILYLKKLKKLKKSKQIIIVLVFQSTFIKKRSNVQHFNSF